MCTADTVANAKRGDFQAIKDSTAQTLINTVRKQLEPKLAEWAEALGVEKSVLKDVLAEVDTVPRLPQRVHCCVRNGWVGG